MNTIGDVIFCPKWERIMDFSDQPSQIVLKSDLKNPGFVPFGTIRPTLGRLDNHSLICPPVANVEHLRLWRSGGKSLLQFIHFTFAFGGMLTPLYTEPFLAAKDTNTNASLILPDSIASHHLTINRSVYPSVVDTSFMSQNMSLNTTILTDTARVTNVHYAFLITGVISAVCVIPYIILFFKTIKEDDSSEDEKDNPAKRRKIPRHLHVFMVALLCLFYILYCCVEDTFASFLMTFVVTNYDHVSKSEGAYITTFYWALFAVGRFISVFLTKYLTAVQMMYLCSCMMSMAFTAFLISAHFGLVTVLTVCAGLAGVGMSSLFPSGMSWSEAELTQVTATISTLIFIMSSIGVMINPLYIGYLIEEVDPMWFCYVLLGQTLAMVVIFWFLLCFNRCFLNVRYGKLHLEPEVEVDEPLTAV